MKAAAQGFTLVELAVVIALIAVLTAFGTLAWTSNGENRDATLIQAAQANLQAVISQGSARLDTNPQNLPPANVVNATQELLQNGGQVTFSSLGANRFRVIITTSGRGADFQVATNGDVTIPNAGLQGTWSQYGVANGVIRKL